MCHMVPMAPYTLYKQTITGINPVIHPLVNMSFLSFLAQTRVTFIG